nr:hypothetical protein [Nanoarchaeum sp.]
MERLEDLLPIMGVWDANKNILRVGVSDELPLATWDTCLIAPTFFVHGNAYVTYLKQMDHPINPYVSEQHPLINYAVFVIKDIEGKIIFTDSE